MYKFASFVLTKNSEYYLENLSSHENVIKHYNLLSLDNNERLGIVRVKFHPSKNSQDLSSWKFQVCNDIYPEWTYKDDPSLEERARKTLARIAGKYKIAKNIKVDDYTTAIAGDYSVAIAGDYSASITGYNGTSTSKYSGKSITMDDGTAISGAYGKAIAGTCGTAIAGCNGKSIAGVNGTAKVGEYGTAITECNGKASAGENGIIDIEWHDGKRYRKIIGYVGEDGIKPNVFYKVENGKLVKA